MDERKIRTVYLFGAGATHACVKHVGSAYGTLMKDLGTELANAVNALVRTEYAEDERLHRLVNEVVSESTDFEHIITFLEESSSAVHQKFANQLRTIFQDVLRRRLKDIERENSEVPPAQLYEACLDMHNVPKFNEELGGILTLNYDNYLEAAIEGVWEAKPDYGVSVDGSESSNEVPLLLKLHGSFQWAHLWPIASDNIEEPLWIPPGIQKAKDRYPFNIIWGLARQVLDCDILRIVGCALGPNDWDLISLIFTTRHTNAKRKPYEVQVIDSPRRAIILQDAFDYLDVKSILEIQPVGDTIVGELLNKSPRAFRDLPQDEKERVIEEADKLNWFRHWLRQMAEALYTELGDVSTLNRSFEAILED